MVETENKVRAFLTSLTALNKNEKGHFQRLELGNSRYLKDLRVNFSNAFKPTNLSYKELSFIGLSISINEKNGVLQNFFEELSQDHEASAEEIAEVFACTSLLAGNNVLYRFRHFVKKEKYDTAPARIKMNIMAQPVLGKGLFELISLVVSAVNGCERCVRSHEESVIELGYTEEHVFDAIRLASVIISVAKLVN